MKFNSNLILMLASLALVSSQAHAEKSSQQHRTNRAVPRVARTKPPTNTTSTAPTADAFQALTRNEKIKASTPTGTGQRQAVDAARNTNPNQAATQNIVQGNLIGTDAAKGAKVNGKDDQNRAQGTWSDDWADEGLSLSRPATAGTTPGTAQSSFRTEDATPFSVKSVGATKTTDPSSATPAK